MENTERFFKFDNLKFRKQILNNCFSGIFVLIIQVKIKLTIIKKNM